MASQNMEKLESNVAIIDYAQDVPLSTSYEVAMEALSSLIRQKKRGDQKGIGGKYGKLDRMRIYLKVTIYYSSNFLQMLKYLCDQGPMNQLYFSSVYKLIWLPISIFCWINNDNWFILFIDVVSDKQGINTFYGQPISR